MPTVAEIERLEALIDRLRPLADKQRGELIAADDWNVLVGALIEVGRAAVTAGDVDTVAPHEHPDEVGIGWLDPRVRQLVTGGGVKDPAIETEFIKLRRDVSSLSGRLDRVGADVDRSRLRIDEVATNDLARAATVARLDRKVLGAEDDRADIADLRGTLRSLETEVGRAVEVGTLLERDGQTIDVPGLADRVSSIEQLRERLTQPDGELLDAATLEIRLQELQAGFVTQGDLTEAIDDVRGEIGGGGFDLSTVLDEARLAGRAAAAESVDTLGNGLRSDIARRFETIAPTVDEAVANATGSLRDDILGEARRELDDAVSGGDASVRTDLTALIEQRFGAASSLVDEGLAGLPEMVGSQVAEQIDEQVGEALGQLAARVGGFEDDLGGLADLVRANETSITDTNVRIETERRQNAAARNQLRRELTEQISGVEGRFDPRIAAAVDEARSVLRADIEATVGAARRDLETRLAQVAREAAATEVQVLSTSIRTDVQSILRQEIDASLSAVRSEIAEEMSSVDRRVAGMVSNAVTRATADLPRLVGAEIEAFRPEIERIVTNRINRIDRPPIDRPPIDRPPIG